MRERRGVYLRSDDTPAVEAVSPCLGISNSFGRGVLRGWSAATRKLLVQSRTPKTPSLRPDA